MRQLTEQKLREPAIEIPYSADLAVVLTALGVPWTEGRPTNGAQGTVLVPMDGNLDARLEQLVGDLSDLRWRYEPGRTLQLAFDLDLPEANA